MQCGRLWEPEREHVPLACAVRRGGQQGGQRVGARAEPTPTTHPPAPQPPREAQTASEARAYLRAHHVEESLEALLAGLLGAQPPAPLAWALARLGAAAGTGGRLPRAFEPADLPALFGALDPSEGGTVPRREVRRAAASLGCAPRSDGGGEESADVDEAQFVSELAAAMEAQREVGWGNGEE